MITDEIIENQTPPSDWRANWNTSDEMGFLFGSAHYVGLTKASMDRINKNRYLFGMKPTTREAVIKHYLSQLFARRWDPNVNPHAVGHVLNSILLGGAIRRD